MGRKRKDELSAEAERAALADIRAERSEKERREALISQVSQMRGQIMGAKLVGDFGRLSAIKWLADMKASKAYKELGTWEELCNSVGFSRSQADEDIENLEIFGEKFLADAGNLGLGYRDIRKLKKLSREGLLLLQDGVINIGGTEIPFDPEFKEEIQAALEKFAEDSQAEAKAQKRIIGAKEDVIKKQERELRKLAREAQAKGLSPEEDAFLKQMKNLRISFDGYMLQLDHSRMEFKPDEMTPRMTAALVSSLQYMRTQINAAYDAAVETFGDPAMFPEADRPR